MARGQKTLLYLSVLLMTQSQKKKKKKSHTVFGGRHPISESGFPPGRVKGWPKEWLPEHMG